MSAPPLVCPGGVNRKWIPHFYELADAEKKWTMLLMEARTTDQNT